MSKDIRPLASVDHEWIAAQLNGLERRISAIGERAMRHTILVEFIEGLDASELVAALDGLGRRSADGRNSSREVLQEFALEPFALAMLPYSRLKAAYKLASEENLPAVAGMFMGEPMRGSPTVDESYTGNEHYDLPLGIRRQAARTTNRFVIDRLLHDKDYRVISQVLQNPLLVERDVVSIAARRPTRPEILEIVSKHRKWASRYRIRKALACNPYTPHQVSRRLLSTLMLQDLRDLLSMGAVPEALRNEARRILAERKPKTVRTKEEEPQALEESGLDELIDDAEKSLLAAGWLQDSDEVSVCLPGGEEEQRVVFEGMSELEDLVGLAEDMLSNASLTEVLAESGDEES
jgi:hypothetical protein